MQHDPVVKPQLLTPIPLTAAAFAPFGDVIEVRESATHFLINEGNTMRYHDLANIDVATDGGQPIVSIFRSTPLIQPIAIKLMERHPLGSQLFMPLFGTPYLVVVAPKGEFDASAINVFIANGEQGVNYHAGTWHHYCLALEHMSDFLVLDRAGTGDNCQQVTLDGSLLINPDY
jgi:ureidoglycolate lyase